MAEEGWSNEKGNRTALSENGREGAECRDTWTHALTDGCTAVYPCAATCMHFHKAKSCFKTLSYVLKITLKNESK